MPASRSAATDAAADRQDVQRIVADALRAGRVALAYQPVVHGAEPCRVSFYEGLIRLFDRHGRMIPAADFIDAVEDDELGRQIDIAALRKGLEALSAQPALRLSINMSVLTIGDGRWMTALEDALSRDPTVAERLIVEFTERAALSAPGIARFMDECRGFGLSFALDDFGAGYTSFRNLRELHFEIIKIDGEFIRDIDKIPGNRLLTQAILALAGHFGTLAVAECVESPAEAEVLRQIGVDAMQGWLFGGPALRPSPPLALATRRGAGPLPAEA